MKHYSRWLLGAFAAGLFTACSSDVINPEGGTKLPDVPDTEGDGVYLSVNIKMPTPDGTTRSYTDGDNSSNDGTEVGKDYENNVNTVYLVLATNTDVPETNNVFIAWGEIPAADIVKNTTGAMYTSKATLSKSQLAAYYPAVDETTNPTGALANNEVNVYVFCNPTLSLRRSLEDAELDNVKSNTWINAVGEYSTSESNPEVIWNENNFLMSNISTAVRSIPKTLAAWDAFTESAKPFDLSGLNADVEDCDNSVNNSTTPRGPISVERTAARLDFRDGSPDFPGKKEEDTNLYQVVFNDAETECYINIKLNKMSLTNMNKQFYYLRRVSDNGLPTGNGFKVCGPERPWFTSTTNGLVQNRDGNYIISPTADMMTGPILSDFSNFFNYPFFSPEGEIDNPTITDWFTSLTDDVIKGTSDEFGDKQYHIWRYVTENTIPGVENQKNGQSTGIIFKGKMIATETALKSTDENISQLARIINNQPETEGGAKPLTGDLSKDPILYKFKSIKNNVGGVYATWENVQQAAKAAAITPVWEEENDPNSEEHGYWRLDINRSAPIFQAVFGSPATKTEPAKTGSCGSYTFKDPSTGKDVTVMDPLILRDAAGKPILNDKGEEQPDWNVDSPNYKWMQWAAKGKPIPQTTNTQSEDSKLYTEFKAAAVAANITLYQTSYDGNDEYGYYCYYYYWNRHNDNGLNGIMGPMEFAIVRNNVYKLAVTKINELGHPRFTENDPNKPTPDTDDEIDDVYITVDVNVLPWVVRINDIVF